MAVPVAFTDVAEVLTVFESAEVSALVAADLASEAFARSVPLIIPDAPAAAASDIALDAASAEASNAAFESSSPALASAVEAAVSDDASRSPERSSISF